MKKLRENHRVSSKVKSSIKNKERKKLLNLVRKNNKLNRKIMQYSPKP